MRIESITLRKLKMPLKSPFETSFGTTHDRTVVLVEVLADGLTGWSEVTALVDPFFNSETVDTAWLIIRGFLVPLLLGKEIGCAAEIPRILSAIRGHEMARAGIENALWDVEAQQRNLSLAHLLGGTQSDKAVPGQGLSLRSCQAPSPRMYPRNGNSGLANTAQMEIFIQSSSAKASSGSPSRTRVFGRSNKKTPANFRSLILQLQA